MTAHNSKAASSVANQTVDIHHADGVATLTITRPDCRNALDPATYQALSAALKAADADTSIHAIIITGAQGHFTAGNDLRAFQAASTGARAGMDFLHTIVTIDTPIIAAVEGSAVGIGVTLLLHCDFVYVAEDAKLRLPFVSLGLCPEGASSLLLAKMVGMRTASDWLLSARMFSGTEAASAGLATASAPAGGTLAQAQETGAHLARQPRAALRLTKAMQREPLREAITHTLNFESEQFGERLKSPEAQAAFAAFFAKPPR